VTLLRQSRKKTDPKYNFYLQNNAPPDAVELAMIYDPQNPDPTLMVSRESGSIRGTAHPPAWHDTSKSWGTSVSVERPVARPWVDRVEILSSAWVDTTGESLGASLRGADDQQSPYTFSSSRLFFGVQKDTRFRVKVQTTLTGTLPPVTCTLDNASKAKAPTFDKYLCLWNGSVAQRDDLHMKPIQSSAAVKGDKLVFWQYNIKANKDVIIGDVPITFFKVQLHDNNTGSDIPYNGIAYITDEPKMPALQATILPDLKTSVAWHMTVDFQPYLRKTGYGWETPEYFPPSKPNTPRTMPSSQTWDISSELGTRYRGGNGNIGFEMGGESDNFLFKIKGTNPSTQTIEDYIGCSPRFVKAIARKESGVQQFNESNGGYGLKGDTKINPDPDTSGAEGIMQLLTPP